MKVFKPTHLTQTIAEAVAKELVVGTSIIIAQHGDIIFETHAGFADREHKKPVTANTMFRLASLSKPLVSSAAFVAIEKGLLSLDAPVTDWLPYFTPKAPDGKVYPITIRHLLSHTAGLGYAHCLPNNAPYADFKISDGIDDDPVSLEENMHRLAAAPLFFKPGTQWLYSLSIDVLGTVLEKATGQTLPQVIQQYLTNPLGMNDTSFCVQDIERLSQAYFDNPQGGKACLMSGLQDIPVEGKGTIYLAPGRATNPQFYPSGGGGLSATAKDYFIFLETIRKGGAPILHQDSIAALTQDAVPDLEVTIPGPGYGFGLGFGMVRDPKVANTPRSIGSYEWAGAYGNKAFVDPVMGLTVVILTNTAFYGLKEFQELVTKALYQDLT